MILLLTHTRDITCDLMIMRLNQRRSRFIRLNTDRLLTEGTISWARTKDLDRSMLYWHGHRIRPEDVHSTWYRRPVLPEPLPETIPTDARSLASNEAEFTLRGLLSELECLWISDPQAIDRASSKMYQLNNARILGLEIPDTLITTNPEEARDFITHRKEVIAKPLSKIRISAENGIRRTIFTHIVREDDLERIDQVALSPTLFQERIPKRADIRVTIVGSKVFPTELIVPDPETNVDWRIHPLRDIVHRVHQIPDDLSHTLLLLTKRLGLNFAAIDLIATLDGRYIFLELNANGQWAWIEILTGQEISLSLAELLEGVTIPL